MVNDGSANRSGSRNQNIADFWKLIKPLILVEKFPRNEGIWSTSEGADFIERYISLLYGLFFENAFAHGDRTKLSQLTLFPRWSRSIWITAWEQRKLGEVVHRVIRKNEGNQSDLPLTISAQHGLVDQRDYFNSQVASRDMSGYYLLENGEFAYNKSTSADSPWGAIKRLTKYEKGCLSTLYICFRLNQGDPEFLVTYYETNRWHGAVQMIAAEGARNHGLLNIAPDDFFETALTLPCSTEEQRQIGCFFTQLNSLITLHQCKCQHCSLCGYLSWEQRKLGELYSLVSEKNDLTFGRESIISVANMYFNANVNVTDEQYLRTYNVMRLGDIAFEGHSNKEFSHGRFVENYIGDGIVSHIFTVLRPRVPFDVNYWRYAINNEKLMRLSLIRSTKASTMMHDLVPSDFLREAIPTPTLAEQMRIGTFFVGLDNLITLHR